MTQTIKLERDQEIAFFQIRNWYEDRLQPFWRLAGYAGTGKTVLISFLLRDEAFYAMGKQVAVVAYTHKAASVLRRKGVLGAQTIHSLIYKVEELPSGDYYFVRRNPEEMRSLYSLIVVDEASMVSKAMRKDIDSFGIPVLYVGDSEQLPPIGDDPEDWKGLFMASPESRLTEIRRQALDSPIIRLSMDIRNGKSIPFGQYGSGVWVVDWEDFDEELLLKSDQIIVGKNNTRRAMNRRVRKALGFNPKNLPGEGEPIICLQNNMEIGVYNGMIMNVVEDQNEFHLEECVGMRTKIKCESMIAPDVMIEKDLKLYFDGSIKFETPQEERYYLKRNGLLKVDFSRAITCHKAQGSSYRRPIVFEERMGDRVTHRRWFYTAVTRAEQKLIVVRNAT